MFNFTSISSISENTQFLTLSWPELKAKCRCPHKSRAQSPQSAKKTAPLIACHNGKTRSKEQTEQAMFGLLRADLDDATNLTPQSIASALFEQRLESFVIYSTLSHLPDAPRYRVFVELAEPAPFSVWADLQFALAELLVSDPCVNRPSQFMILPTTIKATATHYETLIEEGAPLAQGDEFWLSAMQMAEQHETQASEVSKRHAEVTPRPYIEPLIGNQVSIINLVNLAYEWPDLLAFYGYKRKGRNAWIAPESTSGTAGVHILTSSTDGKERIFSHHASDPAGNRLCDKFDLITLRQFGGNPVKALAEIAKEHFPEAHKHNRREWSIAKRNELIANIRAIRQEPVSVIYPVRKSVELKITNGNSEAAE